MSKKLKKSEGRILLTGTFLSHNLLEKISRKLCEQKHKPGLYIVATPIGNIFDISFRAIHVLRSAKYIFAEDTRQSRKLLDFYDIKAPLIACHEYNEDSSPITSLIKKEDICALISDAGTPLISDPGYRLVNWCITQQIDVSPVPGACAFIAGLSSAGLPTDRFSFWGFLPNKPQSRKSILNKIKDGTAIFLESPHRIRKTLKDMLEIWGDSYCCVCREMTKIFEEFRRGKLSELSGHFAENQPRGEFIIIVLIDSKSEITETESYAELSALLGKDTVRNAVRTVAEKYKLPKRTVYARAMKLRGESET